MKTIGIVCSPRQSGNTEILVGEALKTIKELGGETELISTADKNISPCNACNACTREGLCPIKDDMQEIYTRMLTADAIILGSPVYFQNVSAQAKAIMDRTFAFMWQYKLRGKVGGAVVATRRVGGGEVKSLLYSYFITQKMLVAGGAIGYGSEKGEVRDGAGGARNTTALEEARRLGKDIHRLCQRLNIK